MRKGFDYTGISVVTMCHDGNGKYLMEHRGANCRDEQNTWSPVGSGGLRVHENLEEAVKREVKEECGATATNIEFLGCREVFREVDGQRYHWIAFDFKAQINPDEVSIMEPEKCVEHKWCTVSEIPFPRHSQFPFFLEQHKEKL